jgi:ElaA protein
VSRCRSSAPRVSCGRSSRGSARRSGAGKALMQQAISQLFVLYGKQPIRIGAQSYLEKFYTDLGFKSTGHYYLEDEIPHMSMVYKQE